MSYVVNLKPHEVDTPEKLARFCQEQTGIPYPSGAQIATLKKGINEFFLMYPQATYSSLTNIVLWAKANNKRYSQTATLIKGGLRFAFVDGYLPEIDPKYSQKTLDEQLTDAINVEKDPQKKMMLINSWSQEALDIWSNNRQKESV